MLKNFSFVSAPRSSHGLTTTMSTDRCSNLRRRQLEISFSNLLWGCAESPARHLHVLYTALIWSAVRAWSGRGHMAEKLGLICQSRRVTPSWWIKSPIRAELRDLNACGPISYDPECSLLDCALTLTNWVCKLLFLCGSVLPGMWFAANSTSMCK